MPNTDKLALPKMVGGQNDAYVVHNESLNKLDGLVLLAVEDRDATSPPSAADGELYIVGPSATGDWSGKDGQIAHRVAGQWRYYAPQDGWRAVVIDERVTVEYRVNAWFSVTGESVVAIADTTGGTSVAGSFVAVTFDVDVREDSGSFGHDTGSNTDQVVLKEIGDYIVHAQVTIQRTAGTGASRLEAKLTLNSSDVANSLAAGAVSDTLDRATLSICALVQNPSANGVLRLEVQRATGSLTCSTLADASRIVARRV